MANEKKGSTLERGTSENAEHQNQAIAQMLNQILDAKLEPIKGQLARIETIESRLGEISADIKNVDGKFTQNLVELKNEIDALRGVPTIEEQAAQVFMEGAPPGPRSTDHGLNGANAPARPQSQYLVRRA